MDVLKAMLDHDLEQIVALNDPATGLLGFIVIHDTTRGPGIGGCRLWPYSSTAEALRDATHLAIAMTYKCALAGLNAGGAKGVLIQSDRITDRPAMMRALGRYVESLGGRFYTSSDLGLRRADLQQMQRTSPRFVAVPDAKRLDLGGATATGVVAGMRAALKATGLGAELDGRRVAVQGLGAMGSRVAERLLEAGAHLVVADPDPERVAPFEARGATVVDPTAIYEQPVDVFSPCAISDVLSVQTVRRLRCKAVVGAANNQLVDEAADRLLLERGIRYAPDFAVNSGAVILATASREGAPDTGAAARAVLRIGETVGRVLEESEASGEPTGAVANRLAREALVRPRSTERQWWPVR